jgi:hypothetical protein
MKKAKPLWMGARKTLTRSNAINEYVVLRLRAEEIDRLDYLLKGLKYKRIGLPEDSPYSTEDLADAVRTCFFGWFATLTDINDKAVYAFNCLLTLFPARRARIINVQVSLEACRDELQQFRNNVAFHARADITAHIRARKELQDSDTFPDLLFAIKSFKKLMDDLIGEELKAIPELPNILERMNVIHHPIFSRYKPLVT